MEEIFVLKELAKGNADAYKAIFMKYHPKLVHFLMGFLHDGETARDIAQDIFLSIWHHREKMDEVRSFSSYLFTMARNAVYNYFKSLLVQEKYNAYELMLPYQTESLEEEIFARELQMLISGTVEQMPEQRKRIFKMSRIEGLTNERIAKMLNISRRTVENHITSALSDLRKAIKYTMNFF